MAAFWEWLASSTGTILLAVLAGAGGSALLELLWRPRRDSRRAAAMLTAEVVLNTELLILQAHARTKEQMSIPSDLRMSVIAWNAVAPLVSELPTGTVRQLVKLYNQYEALNRHIESFGEALDRYKNAEAGTPECADAETMVLRILDVFNTGLDATLGNGQALLLPLAELGGIKETEEQKAEMPNYADITAEHLAKRHAHVEALRATIKPLK